MKKINQWWCWLCLAAALWPLPTLAQSPFRLAPDQHATVLTPHVRFLRDPAGTQTIEQIRAAHLAGNLLPLTKQNARLGFTSDTVWAAVPLVSGAPRNMAWFVQLTTPLPEEVDWFVFRNGKLSDHVRDGAQMPRGGPHSVPAAAPVLILHAEPEESVEVYVRVRSRLRVNLLLSAYSATGFLQQQELTSMFIFICLGIFLVLTLISLSYGLYARNRGYLYYAFSTLFVLLLLISTSGYARVWNLPGWHYFVYNGQLILNVLAIFSMFIYLRWFFDLPAAAPRLNRSFSAILGAMLVLMLWMARGPLLPRKVVMDLLTLASGAFAVGICVWMLRRGNRTARFYLSAWWFFWLLVAVEFAQDWGFIPQLAPVNLLPLLGLITGYSLFVLAMADRLRLLHQLRETERIRADTLQRELTVGLERQVAERTASLQQLTTQLEQSNQALEDRQRRLIGVLNALPDLVYRVSLSGRIHEVHSSTGNPIFQKQDLFLGKLITDLVPPEVSATILDALQEANRTGIHKGAAYSLPLPGGSIRWIELSIAKTTLGPPDDPHFVAIARDITERKQAEEALRASEEQYRFLTESMYDVVWIINAETRQFTYVSPSLHTMFGFGPEE